MISINPYEIILQMVNFGILYFLLKKFLAGPLSSFLSNRAASIKQDIDHADQMKKEAESLLIEQKESIKNAHLDAQVIRKKAEESAQKELNMVLEKGKKMSDDMIGQAKKDIALQANMAKKELLTDVTALSLQVVEKFVSNDLTQDQKNTKMKALIHQVTGRNED